MSDDIVIHLRDPNLSAYQTLRLEAAEIIEQYRRDTKGDGAIISKLSRDLFAKSVALAELQKSYDRAMAGRLAWRNEAEEAGRKLGEAKDLLHSLLGLEIGSGEKAMEFLSADPIPDPSSLASTEQG